ncbi:demethoxyubiquinone hydroxylase family protein [Sphingomonas sp.]|uniref:demethoxyubiquinone hydroxylase family protein n=1 Tax=Sphingomonas sp. TaxID=28214 RepID=UPI0025DC3F37|nr:demethoxyubiquinone hydroxylase family protein [Sphingomonas sp.]
MNLETDTESMIRVDQAGEYGATRIYAGQLAIMDGRSPAARSIARMAAQEERHRQTFDRMMAERGVRPTLLQPIWNVAGYGLGMATALLGPGAAMACTVAVETEIDRHYGQQIVELGTSDPELSEAIADFQAEEVEHKTLAAAAPGNSDFPLMSAAIRLGCRVAIAVSKRI